MQVETTRFGTIDVSPEEIYTFTQPILGFATYRRFVLREGPSPFLKWLQSTEVGDLAFIIMDPKSVMPDYAADLGPHDLSELAAAKAEEVEIYTLVVVPQDRSKIRTNLKAPIILNPGQRLGKQVVLDNADYPVQFYLSQASGDSEEKEVSNARSNA